LVTRQSGVSEVFKNSLKVDCWDINEMANQITAAVQNDDLRTTLVQNAQAEYSSMSWEKASDKIMDLYRQHTAGATV